jgi:hypothetical protein
MGAIRNAYNMLVRKAEGNKHHLEDPVFVNVGYNFCSFKVSTVFGSCGVLSESFPVWCPLHAQKLLN